MTGPGESLVLAEGPGAVRSARAFVRAAMAGRPDELVSDAELVVSELVTNALLHAAGADVEVSVVPRPRGVTVEVRDEGLELPVSGVVSDEAMTGRGLKLVAALASRWGVRAADPRGKVVWATLTGRDQEGPATPDLDAALTAASWLDGEAPLVEVALGLVPTDLLLEAKTQVDNLVRELSLAREGSSPLPHDLTDHAATMIRDFGGVRRAVRDQARAAAARHEPTTDLVLRVRPADADAGERYLDALDAVDRYAAAARLLSLESPPVHRVLRDWYVRAVIDHVRTLDRGDAPTPPPSWPQALAGEVTELSRLRSAVRRTTGLHEMGVALASSVAPAKIAAAVLRIATQVLGARSGTVCLGDGPRTEVLAAVGLARGYVEALEGGGAAAADLPETLVMAGRQPLWWETADREAICAEDDLGPRGQAGCAVPLAVARRHGVLALGFDRMQTFGPGEREFVLALADQAALALTRSELYLAEQASRREAERNARRLDVISKLTARLTRAASQQEILDSVVQAATHELGATGCRVHMIGADGLLHRAASAGQFAPTNRRWDVVAPDDPTLPGGVALATGRTVVLDGRADTARQFPALSGLYDDDRRLLVCPLRAAGESVGLLTLVFAEGPERRSTSVLSFASTLADATTQALQQVRATQRALVATDRLRFLADASVALSGSLDLETTLRTVARLLVPRLADWCIVQLLQDGQLTTVAIQHADPAMVHWAEEAGRRYPADAEATTGAAEVIRSGVSQLVPAVTDEMIVAGATDPEHLAILRSVGMSSVLIVPLVGRGSSFGSIALISGDPERRYDEEDLAFAEDLARRAALAVETVTAFHTQQGRLETVTRIAEAAQLAILTPAPAQVGRISLAARYTSAAEQALVGGDLYEVVPRAGAVRLLIADVRGKGLEAVRNATIALGEFRAAAADLDRLTDVAAQLDRRLRSYLGPEDFVTAMLAEVSDDGLLELISCGHPPAILLRSHEVQHLSPDPSPPLGLGAPATALTVQLHEGDRVLLYTDGLIEARRPDRTFVELGPLLTPLQHGALPEGLDGLLAALRRATGGPLGDDLALLVMQVGDAAP